jgi:protease secretion system membrane fusion protein
MNQPSPLTTVTPPSEAAVVGVDSTRLKQLQRWASLSLVGGLVAFIVWAALAPLDEGVPSPASVAIDTKRKTIQHQQGGIIREVLVREGDQVKDDQVLLRLEDGAVRANMEAARQRYLGLRAMESRLLAEQTERDRITFHLDVLAEAKDPLIQRHIDAQEQLFRTRRAALQADLAGIEESIRGQEALRQSFMGMIESRRAQLRLIQEQLGHIQSLVKEGYAPRNQQLDLERQVADIMTTLTDLNGNMLRATQLIAELRQRAISRRQDYRKETDAQLADVTREAQSDEGRLRALRDEVSRTEIRSPANGQVVGLIFQTVGGVIGPGQRVLDVVPEKEALILEARVAPHLINSIEPGLLADVRFSSFAHSPQLVVQGKVVSVSGDLLTEQTNLGPMSYFLARVEVTPEGMKTLGRHQMQPGMPAEVIIKTGERTLLTYLLHPLTRRVASSMKEQ